MSNLLDQLRNDPTPQVIRRAVNALRDIPEAARKKLRRRKLPIWIPPMLKSLVYDTFMYTLAHLPESLEFDDIADYIEAQIEKAVEKACEPLEGDRVPMTPYMLDRGLQPARRYKGQRERAGYSPVNRDDDSLDAFRERLEQHLDEFYEVIRTSWDRKLVTALSMFLNGAKLTRIYEETRLTGPMIETRYTEALAFLHETKKHKQAG